MTTTRHAPLTAGPTVTLRDPPHDQRDTLPDLRTRVERLNGPAPKSAEKSCAKRNGAGRKVAPEDDLCYGAGSFRWQ